MQYGYWVSPVWEVGRIEREEEKLRLLESEARKLNETFTFGECSEDSVSYTYTFPDSALERNYSGWFGLGDFLVCYDVDHVSGSVFTDWPEISVLKHFSSRVSLKDL